MAHEPIAWPAHPHRSFTKLVEMFIYAKLFCMRYTQLAPQGLAQPETSFANF